ncbi:MAG: HD domain-containing protein [Acidimicrobiia bacterium]|nr:HD domain-containing protein [Acidimicrobiia bacterium]
MQLSAWAEAHARPLLSPLGRRWRHSQSVAGTARDLARSLTPEDADVLVAAAYLHDVGYAPKLAISGFHPLDGGRYLRALGHGRLAGLVAYHTGAQHEAKLHGLQQELARFDDEQSLVAAALTYCDLTNGPDGERLTPEQRIIDVEARYGSGSPVTTGLRAAWPQLLDAVCRVEELRRP